MNATLKYHISQYEAGPGLVQNLLNSFYVDDLVKGERGVEECLSLYQKCKNCLSEGGFNLRIESGFQIHLNCLNCFVRTKLKLSELVL